MSKSPQKNKKEEEIQKIKNTEEKREKQKPIFFTINGYTFRQDEFNEYSKELIELALIEWQEGEVTKATQPNKILDIILKQIDGLSM